MSRLGREERWGGARGTTWRRFGLLAWAALLYGVAVPRTRAATDVDVPVLYPTQEMVLYAPIRGTSLEAEQVRHKEVSGIIRFLRSSGVVEDPMVRALDAPDVFRNVEPLLLIELRDETCRHRLEVDPEALIAQARARVEAEDLKRAARLVARAREALPCVPRRIGRELIAEILAWSGLLHADPTGGEAQAFLRGALYADPLIVTNAQLPAALGGPLEVAARESKASPEVDVHLMEGDGATWSASGLLLNGIKIFRGDSRFRTVAAGTHFLQFSLKDDTTWGVFLELKPGPKVELVEAARAALGIRERYRTLFDDALAIGSASPALLRGLKIYATRLRREQIYLAGVSLELGDPWISVRSYHVRDGISVPEVAALEEGDTYTASVPLKLSRPWTVDLALGFSSILSSSPEFESSGAGLEGGLFYKLSERWRLGAVGGIGTRVFGIQELVYSEIEGIDVATTSRVADVDPSIGVAFGGEFAVGSSLVLFPDVGYLVHANRLRGVPVSCLGTASGDVAYECVLGNSVDDGALAFNLRALASGPRARLGLMFLPFAKGPLTLRYLARVGYSPLWARLPETATVEVTTDHGTSEDREDVVVSVAPGSRVMQLQQFFVSLGIYGVY